MDDICPSDELTISLLLRSLRRQFASIVRQKHPDLTLKEAREYEEGISSLLIHARSLVNSFHVTVRVPPEILAMICSHLITDVDVFSTSQVCRHWRSALVSSPSVWTRLSCHRISRTIVSLERCKSMPIQLKLDQQSSDVALGMVLLCGDRVSSLTVHHGDDRMALLHKLVTVYGAPVERLYLYTEYVEGLRVEDQSAHELWQDLPSLRELFIRRYSIPIDQLAAPNLVHLALEQASHNRSFATLSILDVLRDCPLLETLFIVDWGVQENPTRDHSPVSLPHLRSIELGVYEVRSGLVAYLHLPPNVAAGFRMLWETDVGGDVPLEVVAAVQHVLRRIDIRCITLAAPPHPQENKGGLLIRFAGLQGSLEITTYRIYTHMQLWNAFFDARGVLFSYSPRIENVRELHIVGCSFEDGHRMDHINAAMPNLVSISFFHCEGPHIFGLLTPTDPSSPPFPHLERVMIFGPESELIGMTKARRDHGVPLKTLIVGRAVGGFEYGHLEDYAVLGEFVEDLRVGCPTRVLEWGAGNEVLKVWSADGVPGPYFLAEMHSAFKFCQFDVPG